jgi:hypothetical protein
MSTAWARPGRLLGTIRAESYCAASAMTQRQAISGWLKANLDPSVLWFVLHAFASFTAFFTWQDEIVRAIKGEEAKDEWKTNMPTSLLIVFWTLTSAGRAKEIASLREAAVEMRGIAHDATEQAELREQRAAERDRRAAEQQERMLLYNKRAIILATLTLTAAIVTLAVAIAR